MKTIKYKIVPCNYVEDEYQIKVWRWYWPFWIRISIWLRFESIDDAKRYVEKLANPIIISNRRRRRSKK